MWKQTLTIVRECVQQISWTLLLHKRKLAQRHHHTVKHLTEIIMCRDARAHHKRIESLKKRKGINKNKL